jgi:glycosyltransferase involved in cell wall biosynthesis
MNILILNTHNPLNASGVVSSDLFRQLSDNGHNVKLLVNSYDANYPEGIASLETSFSAKWKLFMEKVEWRLDKLKRFLKVDIKTDPRYPFFILDEKKQFYSTKHILRAAGFKPDMIIILFAKGFLNAKNIFELRKYSGAEIFWLMFDMAPFTGGCHYAWECKGYQMDCGNCPGLYSTNPNDISNKNLSFKKKYFSKIIIHLLAGSEWQYNQAKASALFKNGPVYKLLLPINVSVFKPVDKEKHRMNLNLTPDRKIIFFGAVTLSEERKGMRYLIESLVKLNQMISETRPELKEKVLLLIAGKGFAGLEETLPFESKYMGYLDNTFGIASAYQAADVFICPSIEDSGPMMINQSIMCGTPVVSFEMGVSLDLVVTGVTGHRARLRDSEDMAKGLFNIISLNKTDYNKMADNCRDLGIRTCAPEIRLDFFENIMKGEQI